jgi:hypothetical protein
VAYEVEIRCDVRKGNPIEKLRCHSDAQARVDVPRIEAATSRDEVYTFDKRARALGWQRIRRAGRPLWRRLPPKSAHASFYAG